MKPLDYLKKLEKFGYEAYIVGGYVRDYLLHINSADIDITTSCRPEELKQLFDVDGNLGGIKIDDGIYHLDITTFRKEASYLNHIPRKIKYVKDLKTDLKRRDFTINSILMNSKGEIIDLLGGKNDLNQHIIRVIGNINKKFKEDPLRMIRALRFMITYNYKIEDKALIYIMRHKKLLLKVSDARKKEELDRILLSPNVVNGMKFLKDMNILTYLNISYDNLVYTGNITSMWAQIVCLKEFPFTKEENIKINSIKKLIKKGSIDAYDIYNYGYEICLLAAKIIGINEEIIDELYSSMKIKKEEKLAINGKEIMNIINCNNKKIKKIKEDLIYQLVSGNLSNNKDVLMRYIKKHWK